MTRMPRVLASTTRNSRNVDNLIAVSKQNAGAVAEVSAEA
jgi:hypothetical protein